MSRTTGHQTVDTEKGISTNLPHVDSNRTIETAVESLRMDLEQAMQQGDSLTEQLKEEKNQSDEEDDRSSAHCEAEAHPEQLLDVDLEGEALQRHAKNIINDVRLYIDHLHEMFLATYEQLNTPLGRDQVYSSLEQPFLERLWPYLLPLFRY